MARDGMVASCHPLASLAGVEVLKSGGNVIDAAIATNAVLAVTQPNYCGLGGDFFCLYYEASTRRAWSMLLERFGTRPLKSLLAPALHYAADGFPLTLIVCQAIRERSVLFDDPEWHRVFVPDGAFPEPGDVFRQPDLARTLAELGDDPDLFYRGRVGQAIAKRLERDGFLTADDLAAHTGAWREPISTTYRGYTVWET